MLNKNSLYCAQAANKQRVKERAANIVQALPKPPFLMLLNC